MNVMLLAAGSPLDHVMPHAIDALSAPGFVFDNHMLMQITAAILLILLLYSAFAARRPEAADEVEQMVPKGMANLLDFFCKYLRDNVVRPVLQHHTDRFTPYIWSVFFFILFCNLLGLVPFDAVAGLFGVKSHLAGTATGNIFVTATFAVCTLLMMVINGLRLGGLHYLAHFCPGPLWLAPLLVPVEIIGMVAKIFALAVRLFANMIAGHILLAVLLGFTTAASGVLGVMIAGVSILGAVAITFLELFVAFLQAFIFTFLTCLFIGQSVVFHHDDHGEHHAVEGAH